MSRIVLACSALFVLAATGFVISWKAPVQIWTVPAGARISINRELRGTSRIATKLRAGSYQIDAACEGFEPVSRVLVVRWFGTPPPLEIVLRPAAATTQAALQLPQALVVATDLASGSIVLDGGAPVELQEGQFSTENLAWGHHTLELTSGGRKATLAFDAVPGTHAAVTAAPAATELTALAVSSYQDRAQVQSSSASSWEATVDTRPAGQVGPTALDLTGLAEGTHELHLRQGTNQQKVNFTSGARSTLSLFITSERADVGSLLVVTGEDGVLVSIDGKHNQRWVTRDGRARINRLNVREHVVQIAKAGFQEEPPARVAVRRGEEAKVEFRLRPVAASLLIRDAMPGTQVRLDQVALGAVNGDGSLSKADIPPGEHAITLELPRFKSKRIAREFTAGATVRLERNDLLLDPATGMLQLTTAPAGASVFYSGPGETEAREAKGTALELEEGTYTFRATAPGHLEQSSTVQIRAGKTHSLQLVLKANAVQKTAVGFDEWARTARWTADGTWYTHKGGGFVLYPEPETAGVFVYTAHRRARVLGGERLRWVAQYADPQNYVLFEIARREFSRTPVVGGKKQKREVVPLPAPTGDALQYTFQVELSAAEIVHSVQQGQQWVVIDRFRGSVKTVSAGRFGFYLPGNDEIQISGFTFKRR